MREGEPPSAARGDRDRPPADGAAADTARDGGTGSGATAHTRRDAHGGVGAPGPGDVPNTLSAARYLAWLYSPAPQQQVFAVLCEIESEIAGSLRAGIDHHVAHSRLQWWSEECERCVQGRPVHPLTRELVKASGDPSRLAGIKGLVDTAVWDLASATFETRKELTAYCERWSAAMFETAAVEAASGQAAHDTNAALSAAAADATETGAEPSGVAQVRVLGAAVRELELLENLAREAHVGRLRVPLDELERAGVDLHGLAKPPWPAALGQLLGQRHQALRATIRDSISALGREEQSRLRGLLVWATLAWRQSLRAQRALPNAIQPRRYHALADGWQAWRAARRAAAGKLRFRGGH
jgi:15-cis-phytoene synthase